MTVKEWLSRAKLIDIEIRELLKEKQQARGSITGVVPMADGERVQTYAGNTYEERLINYVAYSEKIDKRIDKLYTVKYEIEAAIENVTDSTLRSVLIMRYLRFYTWEKISEEMNYSREWVTRALHPRALEEIRKQGVHQHSLSSV